MSGILTDAALKEILSAWANVGADAAREIGVRHGIKASYVCNLAKKHGVRVKRKPKPLRQPRGPNDPRWRWAIERGGLSI